MDTRLLEIHPEELKFIFEPKKICWSSIQLTNNTNNRVAFTVKTTCPKKYCVRPNKGIMEPKSTCEIIFRMQAQKIAPSNTIGKDKFLIESTVVPAETTHQDITSAAMFAKDGGKYIEQKKFVATLVSSTSNEVLKEEEMTLGVSDSSNDKEDPNMIKHVEELKFKVTELESKLSQVQVTVSELEKERRRTKFLKKNHVTLCSIL